MVTLTIPPEQMPDLGSVGGDRFLGSLGGTGEPNINSGVADFFVLQALKPILLQRVNLVHEGITPSGHVRFSLHVLSPTEGVSAIGAGNIVGTALLVTGSSPAVFSFDLSTATRPRLLLTPDRRLFVRADSTDDGVSNTRILNVSLSWLGIWSPV